MKKIFALAIALVSMAAVMTSCNNDDADYIMQPAPANTTVQNVDAQEMMDVSLVVAVTPEQKTYYDDIYTVQTPGQTQTVLVSEMKPASKEEIKALKDAIELAQAFEEEDAPVELEYYSIKLAQVYSANSAKIISRELAAKANRPGEEFDFMNAACLYYNEQVVEFNAKRDIRFFKGIYGDADNLKGFAKVLNEYN